MRDRFDEIYNSVANGQMKQALKQFNTLDPGDKAECFTYIACVLAQPSTSNKLINYYLINGG